MTVCPSNSPWPFRFFFHFLPLPFNFRACPRDTECFGNFNPMAPRSCLALASSTLSQLTKHVSRIFDRFYLSDLDQAFATRTSTISSKDHSPPPLGSDIPFFSCRNSRTCCKPWDSWFVAAQATIQAQWAFWSALPIRTQVTQWLAVRSRHR